MQALRLEPERFAFAVNLSGYATPGDCPAMRRSPSAARRCSGGAERATTSSPSSSSSTRRSGFPTHVDLSGRVYPGLTHSVSEQELDDVRVFLEKQLESRGSGADGTT